MQQWLLPWAAWLEQSGLGATIRNSTWAYPAVEVGHLIGLGLVFGTAVAFDMRLLGAAAQLPVSALAATLTPLSELASYWAVPEEAQPTPSAATKAPTQVSFKGVIRFIPSHYQNFRCSPQCGAKRVLRSWKMARLSVQS